MQSWNHWSLLLMSGTNCTSNCFLSPIVCQNNLLVKLSTNIRLFSKLPKPSCLNPACSYLILQTVSGLNRFRNCDDTKKRWFNDMTMMTLSSRFELTNVDSMKWRWWRFSWSRFKLTNESEQWTWRGKKKKKKVNNNHCGNYHYGSASRTIKSDRADPAFETTLHYFLRAHRSFSGVIGLSFSPSLPFCLQKSSDTVSRLKADSKTDEQKNMPKKCVLGSEELSTRVFVSEFGYGAQ